MSSPIETLEQELARRRAEVALLEQALAVLKGTNAAPEGAPKNDFEGLRITEAARRFIKEMGGRPQETRDIADALLQRGLGTRSKNFVATVYATLDNSTRFIRQDHRWVLKDGVEQGGQR